MARHNRLGSGVDQRGYTYEVNYQPDWLRKLKVTRKLTSGRQSTMSLFRNPSDHRDADVGERVRTGVSCPEQGIDFEVSVRDPERAIRCITITYELPPPKEGGTRTKKRARRKKRERVVFTLEDGLKPPVSSG